jgi:hypothetical protein
VSVPMSGAAARDVEHDKEQDGDGCSSTRKGSGGPLYRAQVEGTERTTARRGRETTADMMAGFRCLEI